MTGFGDPPPPGEKKPEFVWQTVEFFEEESVVSVTSSNGGVFVATNKRVFRVMNDNKLVEMLFGQMVKND